jgi:hypothetical protein
MDYNIYFPPNKEIWVDFYVDANWVKDLDKCELTTWLIFKQQNYLMIWSSQLQSIVDLFNIEVEYWALTND